MALPFGMQPQIILLKEGTDTSQGKAQLISNIGACVAVADVVRTTLGPRGMDKLMHTERGGVTISNDGATIMKTLDIVHPAAKTLVDISLSQDAEVGDGTTTVVLLAAEFLREARSFVEEGVHPRLIMRAYRQAAELAVARVRELATDIAAGRGEQERNELLEKCAQTSLNSKLVSGERDFFARMVVDAVGSLDPALLDLRMLGIKKVQGGALKDSFLVDGVAFKKTFSYAGFEMQPKSYHDPKILLLNIELELKSEKENAEVRLDDPTQYQSIVDAEWNIIYDKLDKCAQSGAKIVLSRLAVGDLATQYFADRDIFCAGRVPEEDLQRVAEATGAAVQTTVNSLDAERALGTCARFEERQIGAERYNIFKGCPRAQTATIMLRGGSDQFLDEADRSLHDAIMIVRRTLKSPLIVPGGGAIDMEVSKHLRDHARAIPGKAQLFINAFARALEVIPRQLADNSGFDATDVLNKLRQKHAAKDGAGARIGLDVNTGGVTDTHAAFVWEPALVKINAIASAAEAACLVLSASVPEGTPVVPTLDLPSRPRRNRRSPSIRRAFSETVLRPDNLILPVFIHDGEANIPIDSMPGVSRLGWKSGLLEEVTRARSYGVNSVVLFPKTPDHLKTRTGEESFNPDGLVQRSIRLLKDKFPDLEVFTDVALDPYNSDGHDGIVRDDGVILNDETVEFLCRQAVSQAAAGADCVSPSDMMDGRVGAIRAALDREGYSHVSIMAYTAKYASAFYGPFRDALASAPAAAAPGSRRVIPADKRTYQQDPANYREALREARADEAEGADIMMVKPGMPYLDVIRLLRDNSPLPIAAYHVSGEYAMLAAAARNGWLDEREAVLEALTCLKRAGADLILTYYARQAAQWMAGE